MNHQHFKENVGSRVELQPAAIWLDDLGFERPALEDNWIVECVTQDSIRLANVGTGLFALLIISMLPPSQGAWGRFPASFPGMASVCRQSISAEFHAMPRNLRQPPRSQSSVYQRSRP